jgi:PleD family two-component response regulator
MAGTTTLSSPRSRRDTSSQAENGNLHVLLVEDNEISQKLLKKQLVRAGCSVVTANDGVEAVEFMLKNASSYHVSSTDKNTGLDNAKVELILMGKWSSCCAGHLRLYT